MKYKKYTIMLSVLSVMLFTMLLGISIHENYYLKVINVFKEKDKISYLTNEKYINKIEAFKCSSYDADILFIGDSITDYFEWNEAFPEYLTANRGIAADVTEGVMNRLNQIIAVNPEKIFILIGINDINQSVKPDNIIENYTSIILNLKDSLPNANIYIESILPTSDQEKNKIINEINSKLELIAKENEIQYINLYNSFSGKNDIIIDQYTTDGIHLNSIGYEKLVAIIKEHLY